MMSFHLGGEFKTLEQDATWKEFILLRNRNVLHVFNLLSHGRRIFRSLIFSSNARFSVHGLAPNPNAARSASSEASSGPCCSYCLRPLLQKQCSQLDSLSLSLFAVPEVIRHAAGDLKRKRVNTTSLVILRRNTELGGEEAYIPPVLLQGIIPSCLLESFHFWQGAPFNPQSPPSHVHFFGLPGEDGLLRGEPTDSGSQWFAFKIEVTLQDCTPMGSESQKWNAIIRRRPLESKFCRISGATELKVFLALLLFWDLELQQPWLGGSFLEAGIDLE